MGHIGNITASREKNPENSKEPKEQQQEFCAQGYRDDKKDQEGQRPLGIEHGKSRQEAQRARRGADRRRGKPQRPEGRGGKVFSQAPGQSLKHSAQNTTGKIKRQEAFGPQRLFKLPSKSVNDPAIQQEVKQTAVHELEGEQLPDIAVLESGPAQSQVTVLRKSRRVAIKDTFEDETPGRWRPEASPSPNVGNRTATDAYKNGPLAYREVNVVAENCFFKRAFDPTQQSDEFLSPE